MAKAQILVVEDETVIAMEIENRLKDIGYTVPATVYTGAEAIKKTAEIHPDLVLMDIRLKGDMDGIAAAAQIRACHDIPVVYLTAYTDEDTLQRAKITEPFGYLIKPFEEKELHTTIEMALYKHQIEKKLRESEARFRKIFKEGPIGMALIAPDFRLVKVNDALCRMLGYTEQELTKLTFVDITHPKDIDKEVQLAQKIFKEEISSYQVEKRHITKDKEVIWGNLTTSVIRDQEGIPLYGLSTVEDITERKQTEEALQDNIHEFKIAYKQATIYAQELTREITERRQAEKEIQKLNEELEQRVADQTRDLSLLYEVTMVASESLDLETTLERSLERVLAAMRSSKGHIHLLNEADEASGEERLHLAVQRGLPSDIVTQIDSISSGGGLANWVIEHGEPLLIPNMTTDPRTCQVTDGDGLAYVGVPMRARGRTLGVLSILGEKEQQFSVKEVALLASVADQVGVAVENARLRQQAERAAVIEERERLARELHDSVTQSLYSLTLFAEAGKGLVEAGDLEVAKHNLGRMGETAQQALREMRLLVHELRPLDLEREGLIGALHQRLSAVEGRVNVKARLVAEELVELPATVEEGLYRIAQEALNNALKHAVATSVTVYLRVKDERVELEVVDDGKGFNPQAVSGRGGMGLVSMQERAEKLGGSLTILSAPEEGTKVKVTVEVSQ